MWMEWFDRFCRGAEKKRIRVRTPRSCQLGTFSALNRFATPDTGRLQALRNEFGRPLQPDARWLVVWVGGEAVLVGS